jgi:predicted nucleotidyltransferase
MSRPSRFALGDDLDVVLPRGTRCVLKTRSVDDEQHVHRPGVHVVVREVRGRVYRVQTVAGAWLTVPRDVLVPEAKDALAGLGARQADFSRLRREVVLATVVGSQAWGLADVRSDEDVRGCFVLPFADLSSLWTVPDEIHDDTAAPEAPQEAFWEVEKLLKQALRADPNTLETLWSPLVKEVRGVGHRLIAERSIFSSQHVLGSFGRYATSQLKKLEGARARRTQLAHLLQEMSAGRVVDEAAAKALLKAQGGEDLHALVRSVFDRGLIGGASFAALRAGLDEVGVDRLLPDEVRPKNAYNLVRLLHSCRHWWLHSEPLMKVEGALRDELLAIKHGTVDLEYTLRLAWGVAGDVDEVARSETRLPPSPDFAAAEAILQEARRQQARVALAVPSSSLASSSLPAALVPTLCPVPLPDDVDVPALRRFLEARAARLPGPWLWLGLTGAHAYGFPSPDSDLDLKAVHAVAADCVLGLGGEPAPVEVTVDDWEGREMDLSSHELGQCAGLLLKGNGNMLERLLGPLPVVTTPLGARLVTWARENLTSRSVHHYRGFLGAMLREHAIDVRDRGGPRAKRLLYMYRAALTGVHLLREGILECDVRVLAPRHGFADVVDTLLGFKVKGELQTLPDDVVRPVLEVDVPALQRLLDEAERQTILPSAPPDPGGLDALLVEARLLARR